MELHRIAYSGIIRYMAEIKLLLNIFQQAVLYDEN